MGNPNWIELMRQALNRHVDKDTNDKIMRGAEQFDTLDEKGKATWMRTAVKRIDQNVGDEAVKIELLTSCSCNCYTGHIESFRKIWKETGDIDQLLDAMHGTVFMVKPIREGNKIIITKAPRFDEQYAKAKTPEEKRYYYCHCDHVRASEKPLSKTYCYCSAGWCKAIFEQSLEREVRIEVLKTVLSDDDCCQFAVHL